MFDMRQSGQLRAFRQRRDTRLALVISDSLREGRTLMPILVTRALKVAGIFGTVSGVTALASSSIEAMLAVVCILALAMASVVTWNFLKDIGQ